MGRSFTYNATPSPALLRAMAPSTRPRRLGGLAPLAVLVSGVLAAGCDIGPPALPYAVAPPEQRARGHELLAQYQCGSCHVIPRVPAARGAVGPPLGAFGRRSYIAGEVPNGPEQLSRWIETPHALVPDTRMPSMGVSAQDARDMAAYLLALE